MAASTEPYAQSLPTAPGNGRRFPHLGAADVDMDEVIARSWRRHSTETPFWVERADALSLSPSDITSFDDIYRELDRADEEELNDRPFEEFLRQDVPRAVYDVGRSSGKTGPKKRIPWHRDVSDRTVDWYAFNIRNYGIEDLEAVEIVGPYGIYEDHTTRAVKRLGGTPMFEGIETNNMKNLIEAAEQGDGEAARKLAIRMEPTMDAVYNDLRAEPIDGIFSAPNVVGPTPGDSPSIHDMLRAPDTESAPEDVRLILLSGTQIDADTVERVDAAYENATTVPMYATSWFGPAFPPADYPERSDKSPEYFLPPEYPTRVVDEDGEEVPVGDRGQLELTIANEGFFWPRQAEDYVTRVEPQEPFDHYGVAEVGRT